DHRVRHRFQIQLFDQKLNAILTGLSVKRRRSVVELELFWLTDHGGMLAGTPGRQKFFLRSELQENYRRRAMRDELPRLKVGILCDKRIQPFRSDLLSELLNFVHVM